MRTGLGWWLVAGLAPIAMMVVALLATSALGAPLPTKARLAGWPALS